MIRSLLFAAVAGISLSFAEFAAAQATVPTDPVGFTTLTVNAKPANIRGFTFLSLNMARPHVFQATPSAVASDGSKVISFAGTPFTAGAFNNTHYVEIMNGASAGRLSDVVSNTANSITIADDLSASVSTGTSIRIRPMWTPATAFGAANQAGFKAGPVASQADNIQIFDPATGGFTTIFYKNISPVGWTKGANASAANDPIPPDVALRIERKDPTSFSFQLAGAVKLGPTGLFVQGGNTPANPENANYLPNPYPMNSVTLASSNLFTGDPNTGVQGGAVASQADTVSIYNSATGGFDIYFYKTTSTQTAPPGWYKSNLTPASDVVIPEGGAVLLKRKNTRPSFIWQVPQPTMNL